MLNYFLKIALFLLLPASLIAQVSNFVTNVSMTMIFLRLFSSTECLELQSSPEKIWNYRVELQE
jgi:hypothetical protein